MAEEFYVPGKWYMTAVPGGFTMRGRYVRPMGEGKHLFFPIQHLLHPGGLFLPDIAKNGDGPDTRWTNFFPDPGGLAAATIWITGCKEPDLQAYPVPSDEPEDQS